MAKSTKVASVDRITVKALINLAGKYKLPYGIDQEFSIDAKRGQELLDAKDAVEVK